MRLRALHWGWLAILVAICWTGCQTTRPSEAERRLRAGEDLFRSRESGEFQVVSRQEWLGDSAAIMDPYTLAQSGLGKLNAMLKMQIDEEGLAEIAYAFSQLEKADQGASKSQGYQLRQYWSGRALYAMGTLVRSVNIAPFFPRPTLEKTDSALLSRSEGDYDEQSGRMQAVRRFRLGAYDGLWFRYEDLCHADLQYLQNNFHYYDRQGLLHSAVHLAGACEEGRSLNYARYSWDGQLRLQAVEEWSASYSQETGETIVDHRKVVWSEGD